MLTPAQSRAARGWLGWSQDDLAKRAKVGLSTVKDFEGGRRSPITNNLEAMRRAFEAEGMEMLFDADGEATGVAQKSAARAPSVSGAGTAAGER